MREMRATWPTRFRIALCSCAHRIREGGGRDAHVVLSNGNVGRGTLCCRRVIREGGAPIMQPMVDLVPCVILLSVRVVIATRLIVGCRKGHGIAHSLGPWGASIVGSLIRTHIPAVRSRGLDVFHLGDHCQRRGI